jgi:hypothetical protein
MDITTARISAKLDALNITAATWCSLSGISSAKWSRAINGQVGLTGQELIQLSRFVEELDALVGGLDPVPVDFRNVDAIRRILILCRGGVRWQAIASPVESAVPEPVEVDQSK